MPRLSKPPIRIGFSQKTGDMVEHAGQWSNTVNWKDNYEFDATLQIVDAVSGRSSSGWYVRDENGVRYYMFMSEMLKVFREKTIEKGFVRGRWTFRKQGPVASLKLVE